MSDSPHQAVKQHGKLVGLSPRAFLALALVVISYLWTFRWMLARWDQPNSYYSHGWLIPPISAVLLFLRRKQLASCPIRPCRWGMAVVLPCLVVHLLGTAWRVGFISGFALLGLLVGLVITVYGWPMMRLTLFPIAFLAFMVPLPEVLIEKVSFRLKLMAASAATGVLDTIGLAAVREGSYIHTPEGPVVVDDVCSGLKYLISLTAFGALYAYLSALRGWLKPFLFFLAIPISFVANVLRVTLLVLIGYAWGVAATQKWYSHDVLGFVLFAAAFTMLFMTESVLLGRVRRLRGPEGAEPEQSDDDQPTADAEATAARAVPAIGPPLILLLAASALASAYFAWPRPASDPTEALARIPHELGSWTGTDYVMDEHVYQVLGTSDVLSRTYKDPDGRSVDAVIVLANQLRRRTHPPEQCIEGEGSFIVGGDDRVEPVQVSAEVDRLHVRELILKGSRGDRVVWFFYKSGPRLTTSYWRHQIGIALNSLTDRNTADALIRLETAAPRGDLESGRDVLRSFLRDAIGALMTDLP